MIKEHIIKKQIQVKQKIVKVASSVFNKFGFKKATIEDIALAAGMGKSSIYYYFKSKEDIFEAVVQQEAHELSLELEKKVISSSDNPKEKIRNYVLIRMKFLKEMVNFFEALKNDYLGNLAFTERIRKKYDKEEQQMLNNILEEGVNQGIFKVRNTKFVALVLVTFLKGLESSLLINEEMAIEDLEGNLDEILQVVFYGMVK
ncbi:MAG: TetR/AcrR family transcriptional regulator [Bacteroidales bacterium]|jgi:AcrR family transcriptional regulator|nr:TetR/AcrR family transcriptional regulator [Bacteroidales bacterium]